MASINLYSTKSKTVEKFTLPKDFASEKNAALLAQALHVYRDRQHKGTSRVQTRGEVSLTKAKVYRQKGTGNARHGAKSAPIFVGGGKAHGPKGIKRELTLPKKMRRKALSAAFFVKRETGSLIGVEGLANLKKTKDAQTLVSNIRDGEKVSEKAKLLLLFSAKSLEATKVFKNMKNVRVIPYLDVNAYTTYFAGKVVIDTEVFDKPKKEPKK